MGYSTTGVIHRTAICCTCDKQFRSSNEKLVNKLLYLHMKQNHPNEQFDAFESCVQVNSANNNNTTQL